jgi:hypothetical protein
VELLSLEASLKALYDSLPPYIVPSYHHRYDAVPLNSSASGCLAWAFCQSGVFYELNRMLLSKSRVAQFQANETSPVFINALDTLQESVRYITYIASLFLRDNPTFSGVGPYICTPFYEAGLGWLKISRYVLDVTFLPIVDHSLVILVRALTELSSISVLAASLRDSLSQLRASRFAVSH